MYYDNILSFFQRIFPNSIFVKSMEPPLEREGKAAKVFMKKPEKNSFEQRLQLTRTVFQLFSFFKKQVPVCIKTKFVDPIYSIMSKIEMVKNIHLQMWNNFVRKTFTA